MWTSYSYCLVVKMCRVVVSLKARPDQALTSPLALRLDHTSSTEQKQLQASFHGSCHNNVWDPHGRTAVELLCCREHTYWALLTASMERKYSLSKLLTLSSLLTIESLSKSCFNDFLDENSNTKRKDKQLRRMHKEMSCGRLIEIIYVGL